MSQQINLYNPLYLRREKYFSAATILWSLLALTIALFAYAGYVNYAIRAPEERARYYDSLVKNKRSEMTDTTARYSPEGRNKQLEAEVRTLESQLVAKKELWRALNSLEIGTGSGFADYLEAFSRRAVAGVWLTGFSIGGGAGDLTIQGRVLRPELVSTFLSALGQEEIMHGRKVVELKLEARQPAARASAGLAAANTARSAGATERFVEFSVRAPALLLDAAGSSGVRAQTPPGAAR